jgi:transposase-like protein
MLFLEFAALINDERRVLQYLRDKGVLRSRMDCPKCGRRMNEQSAARSSDGIAFRCARCKVKRSIRSGSFFVNSRLPLKTLASILYLLSLDVLQKTIAEIIGVQRRIVSDFANLLRERYGAVLLQDVSKLGGIGTIVQV